MTIDNRTREGLLLQVRDVEQASRIKLIGEVMKRDDLRRWFSEAYPRMGGDVEDILSFLYRDMHLYKEGLTILVDGGDSARDRNIVSIHIAYFSIMDEIVSNHAINLDNMHSMTQTQ
jgi:hypothetical protein